MPMNSSNCSIAFSSEEGSNGNIVISPSQLSEKGSEVVREVFCRLFGTIKLVWSPILRFTVFVYSFRSLVTCISFNSWGWIEITVDLGIGIQDIGRIQKVITGPTVSATPSHFPTVLTFKVSSQCQTHE